MGTDERVARIRETIDVLIHTMRLHHRIVEKRIDGLGVHHSQHRMLMMLSRMGKSASQREIADTLDVSPACVARMLKPLNAAGFVDKAGGADGRSNEISVSEKGAQLVEDSHAIFRDISAQMFEGITAEELIVLNGLLRRLQNNLINMEGREPEGGPRGEGSV